MTFEDWWNKNAMVQIFGAFEIKTYRGVPKETAQEIWQACESEQSKRIALAKREAEELAMAIWRDFYKDDSPNFELCDSTAGVLSQIDNMYAGLIEKFKKLQAQNAELVWALEHVKPATRNIDANAWDVIEKALEKVNNE